MGTPREPEPVKLFAALLTCQERLLPKITDDLARAFGPIDAASATFPWEVTDYYRDEMGPGLLRQFVAFERLVAAGRLPEIKLTTQKLEASYLHVGESGGRCINVDPGYLEASKVVLASTKNAAHRIYLQGGIFAESTLQYRHGSFEPFEHTYPDYRWPETRAFFAAARSVYLGQLRESRQNAY
jgi:hypothetical protein